ncbi:MAG: hypothetical protein HY323_09275 [Betaproteobacteria bacterium]|nr:hypothetical protein [Betaproteobacteria bacterium]
MTGLRLQAPCPVCQADTWIDPNFSATRWTCGICGIRCLWENGVMTQDSGVPDIQGDLDGLAAARLGPRREADLDMISTYNRAMCALLHRGGP